MNNFIVSIYLDVDVLLMQFETNSVSVFDLFAMKEKGQAVQYQVNDPNPVDLLSFCIQQNKRCRIEAKSS